MRESRATILSWWEKDLQIQSEAAKLKEPILNKLWEAKFAQFNDSYKGPLIGFLKGNPPDGMNRIEWSAIIDGKVTHEKYKPLTEVIQKKDKNGFMNLFEHVKPMKILIIHDGEKLGLRDITTQTDIVHSLTHNNDETIQEYMADADMSAVASICAAGENTTICSTENKPDSIFSIHSVAKIFTGVLVCQLINENILTDTDLTSTIKIDPDIMKYLEENFPNIANRLSDVTLLDAMTHHAGFTDYMPGYVKAIQADGDQRLTINYIADFLKYAADQVSPKNEGEYSNLGSLFVGLAIEHAYNQYYMSNPNKNFKQLDFYGLVSEYIQQNAGMKHLYIAAPTGAKVNTSTTIKEPTPEAIRLAASPSGGFWTSAEDLRKFGEWLYLKCKNDKKFMDIVAKYGDEFYNSENNSIEHQGQNPSASAMLSISLNTGTVVATVSNSSHSDAHQLESALKRELFTLEEIKISAQKSKTHSSLPTFFVPHIKSIINTELKNVYEQDQFDHHSSTPLDPQRDKERRKAAAEIISSIAQPTKEDYYHVAIIFQHGCTENHYKAAHEYAVKSLDSGGYQPDTPHAEDNRFLVASTYDRWQLNQNPSKPQKYGTQYSGKDDEALGWKKNELIPPFKGYECDRSLIDQARSSSNLGLSSLDEQEKSWDIKRNQTDFKI